MVNMKEEIKNELIKLIELKIKLMLLSKFKTIEEYNNKIINNIAKKQENAVELLYKKYLIHFNEKPKIEKIEIDGEIEKILKEIIILERYLAKNINNFTMRQPIIHCLSDDEELLFYLKWDKDESL